MNTLVKRLNAYEELLHFDQSLNAIMAIFPGLIALWFATRGHPTLMQIIAIVMAMGLTFFSAYALAEYCRWSGTRNDPSRNHYPCKALLDGVIHPWEALAWSAALLVIALAFDAMINIQAAIYQFIALAALAICIYLHHRLRLQSLFISTVTCVIYASGCPLAYFYAYNDNPFAWIALVWTVFLLLAFMLQDALRLSKFFPTNSEDTAIALLSPETAYPNAERVMGMRSEALVTMTVFYVLFFAGMIDAGIEIKLGATYYVFLALATAYTFWVAWRAQHKKAAYGFRIQPPRELAVVLIFIGVVADFYLRTKTGISLR
jgi:4-hydroxybenzoate polyprenyltransferase